MWYVKASKAQTTMLAYCLGVKSHRQCSNTTRALGSASTEVHSSNIAIAQIKFARHKHADSTNFDEFWRIFTNLKLWVTNSRSMIYATHFYNLLFDWTAVSSGEWPLWLLLAVNDHSCNPPIACILTLLTLCF